MIDTVGDTVAVTAFDVARGVCVTVIIVDIDCVTETVGELLFRGIVTVVKDLLGVNDVLGVFEIGEPDRVMVGVIVVDMDPYDGETRGLAVLVIGDCDNVFVGLTVTDVLEDCTRLNVFRGEDVTEGRTVLVADIRADEVDEVIELAD